VEASIPRLLLSHGGALRSHMTQPLELGGDPPAKASHAGFNTLCESFRRARISISKAFFMLRPRERAHWPPRPPVAVPWVKGQSSVGRSGQAAQAGQGYASRGLWGNDCGKGGWERWLKRVFALAMARCPWCQRGILRIITAIMHGEGIHTILWHLKRAVDPPSIAPKAEGTCPPRSLRLVLRLTAPGGLLSPPVGGEAWSSCVSIWYDRARCPLLCPSGSSSNSPSAASPHVPEDGNRPIATVPDV
jgi:hypothetical protein